MYCPGRDAVRELCHVLRVGGCPALKQLGISSMEVEELHQLEDDTEDWILWLELENALKGRAHAVEPLDDELVEEEEEDA